MLNLAWEKYAGRSRKLEANPVEHAVDRSTKPLVPDSFTPDPIPHSLSPHPSQPAPVQPVPSDPLTPDLLPPDLPMSNSASYPLLPDQSSPNGELFRRGELPAAEHPPASQPLSTMGQATVYRILDANLDRAREGLRIIEEWCRFGLNNPTFTETCKDLRQELGRWHSDQLRASRDTPGDPGTELTHPQEQQRAGIAEVLRSNFCRTQEALRVLEEYGKLYSEAMAAACKQMRYRVYTLESSLTGHQRHQKLKQSYLYLVTSPVENLLDVVEAALEGGLTLVQYRDKTSDDLTRLRTAEKLKQLCHRYNALLILNDRVDLALAVDADGVHLGQEDVPIALARQLLGTQRIIGRSTKNPLEMERAIQEGADYIGVGPVYETPTKQGRTAVGLDYVRYAVKNATIPWFAIGGIDVERLADVLTCGAERVAVVRAIMGAEQPTLMTQFFVSQMQRVQTIRASQ